MSGLMKEKITEEVLSEISWIRSAIVSLSDKLQVNTYEICLLRNCVEPEQAESIERVIFLHTLSIPNMSFMQIRQEIAQDFLSATGKEWGVTDQVLKELIELKLKELQIPLPDLR